MGGGAPWSAPSQATLEIDLGAIVANWRGLAARLAPGAECAAVVKADAYGLGAAAICPALAAAGCRSFFVAQIAEGVAARAVLGPGAEILVLNGCLAGEEEIFAAHGLIPVLNDRGQVALVAAYAARTGRRQRAALHLDTGMSRLGLAPDDARALAAEPGTLRAIDVVLTMSHLARAEEACEMNTEQLARFAQLRTAWPAAPGSLANSSGIFLGPAFHFDLARPGAALYGINPVPGRPNPQRAVVTLTAPVLQIRDIAPPETVGYGATFRAAARMRVATVALGYADGWPRALSGSGIARFAGAELPFLGRVSMDTITLDASGAPALRVGDRVTLMDDRNPVDEVAAAAGTIGYEILTGLGRRFARVHHAA
jgi:alanine racemase